VNDGPVVSVVTIFLNAEQFLEEAIESAFAQTYDRWELLLVDDGSSDSSTAIARGYATRHPAQVRYLEHPGHVNRGMSAARNLGVSEARGKYIAFLDADDVWLPPKLEEQVQILDSQPEAAMLYGLSEFWYSWADNSQNRPRDFVHHLGVPSDTLIQPPALLTRFFFAQDAAIPGPTGVLVRREVVERLGGFEEAFRGAYEDEVFYAKVCLNAPVFAVDRCWDKYRQHPDSSNSMLETAGEEYSARLFFLNWLEGYLAEQDVEDAEIWRRLRKELWRCRHPTVSRVWQGRKTLIHRIGRRMVPLPVRHWVGARLKRRCAEQC
jgi:glycosyltransferase involved in cell wall biosynthesis